MKKVWKTFRNRNNRFSSKRFYREGKVQYIKDLGGKGSVDKGLRRESSVDKGFRRERFSR